MPTLRTSRLFPSVHMRVRLTEREVRLWGYGEGIRGAERDEDGV